MGWRETAGVKPASDWRKTAGVAGYSPVPAAKPVVTDPEEAPEADPLDVLKPERPLGAALAGASQGLTLGFGDEMMGAADAAGEAGKRLFGSDEPATKSLADTYRSARDSFRARNKTSEEAQPLTYGASEFLGGAALPLPGGAAAKGAGLGAKMARGALQAGAFGLASGAGKSEADDVGGVTSDALKSAVTAAPFGAGGAAVAEGVSKLAPYFRGKAGERAVQAAGARAGITDRLAKMGVSPDDVPELGNKLLDEGLIPTGLNPFKNPVKQTMERSAALKSAAGKQIGSAIDAADASGASFDPASAQASMRSKMAIANPLEEANATKANKLIEQVGELTPQGEYATPDSFAQANRMKSQAWEGADFSTDPALAPKLYKKAASGMRDDIQRQVGAATSPEVEAQLAAANAKYGTASKANTLATMADSRDVQKQQFSPLRAMISGAAGAGLGAAGGGIGGAGAGATLAPLVTQAIAQRGPNFAAHANRILSQASDSPEAAQALQQLAAQLGIKVEDLYGNKLRNHFNGGEP